MATKPIGPVDEALVRKQLKDVEDMISVLTPHLNKAQTAFGGLEDQIATLNDLKNKVVKARGVYGA